MPFASPHLHVAVLSQWLGHDLLGTSGGLGPTLVKRGLSVEFVTGSATSRSFAALDGPQWGVRREDIDGIAVTRFPFYRSHDRSVLRRFATFASFSASTSALAVPKLAEADVVLVYSSPATAAAAALVAGKFRKTPFVLLVQDVWPDSVFDGGFLPDGRLSKALSSPVQAYVDASYESAAAIIGISRGMRDLLVARGCDPKKTTYVYNWAEEQSIPGPVGIPDRRHGEPLKIMYGGNLGLGQGLETLIKAAARLPRGTVELTFVGDGTERQSLMDLASDVDLGEIRFIPRVSGARMHELMHDAHVHFVSLIDIPIYEVTIPSKLQSMMAAGVPVLASAKGEVARIVRETGAGLACPPQDEHALARSIRLFADMTSQEMRDMGRRSREHYLAEMSELINGDRLARILRWAATPADGRVGSADEARDGR